MTAITHLVLADKDGAPFVPVARARAEALYDLLVRAKQLIGSQRFKASHTGKDFYIEVRIQRPHVWIYIDSSKCPSYLSGLVWIKSWFEPMVEIDEVEYLRTMFLKEAPTVEYNAAKLAGVAEQMKTVRPGMFSGEMRKVVQVLLGEGKSVPYSPSAGRTHGVYRTPDGRPWVIRISSQGVVAYPMLTCRGKNVPQDLGYTPLPTDEPEEPRELLSAAGIKDAYDQKHAFYGACGWAFSANGSKAANCFVGSKDMYSFAWQYQIAIQADPETGNPVSATLSKLAEGYIHGPKTTHMKYPRSDIPMALYSFDPYRGNANYNNDCAAPVFCFFDGEALQTFYYVYAPSTTFGRNEQYVYNPGQSPQCKEFEGVLLRSGPYSETATPVIQFNSTQGYRRSRDRCAKRLMTTEGPLGIGAEGGDFGEQEDVGFTIEVWYMVIERETAGDYINDRTDVLIVTGYEREAAYVATRLTSSNDSYRYTKTYHAIPKNAYNIVQGEPCLATSDLRSINFIVGDYRGSPYSDDTCQSGIRYGELNGYYTFVGTGPGSNIQWRRQLGHIPGWNGCYASWREETRFYSANNDSVPSVDIDVPAFSKSDYGLKLYCSGAGMKAVDASDAEIADWMQFIDLGMNDQLASIVRDAFDPARVAYTKAPNKVAGNELSAGTGFGPYDLSAVTGSTLLFVGVP